MGTPQNAEWGGSMERIAIVCFTHATDPHFVIFSSSLYAANTKMVADPQCCSVDPQST